MTKGKWIIALITCISISTSCSNQERINDDKSAIKETDSIEWNLSNDSNDMRYQIKLADNLFVDAEVDEPQIYDAQILKGSVVQFEDGNLVSAFLGSDPIEHIKEGGGLTYLKDDKSLLILDDKAYFDYHTSLKGYIEGIINTMYFGNLNKFQAEKLNFMPKEEAVSKVNSVLQKIGITPYKEPDIYCMDYKTLQQEQEISMDNGLQDFVNLGKVKLKEEWTEDDEFYYLSYKLDIDGIMCDPVGYTQMPSGLPINGSKVEAIVSKKGIEMLKTTGYIYKSIGKSTTNSPIITIDQALGSVKKKYENIILTNELTIVNISLIYMPIYSNVIIDKETGAVTARQIDLVPTWLIMIKEKNSSGSPDSFSYIRVNALTGEEIH